jgi:hypothetical protein
MVTNYSSAVSSIVCVDLLNLTPIDFQNLCITTPEISRAEAFLKMLYKKLHSDVLNDEHAHLVYIDNDFIIGSKRHNQSHEEFQLGGFENLQENYTPNFDSTIIKSIEKIMLQNNSLRLKSNLLEMYNLALLNKQRERLFTFSFINAFIKVSENLAMKPNAISKRFFIPIYFFDKEVDKDTLVLDRIYYKDQLPIIFIFVNEEGEEFLTWNERYLVFLDKVKPINGEVIDALDMLNAILDKINLVGLSNITSEELAFLDHYSKL